MNRAWLPVALFVLVFGRHYGVDLVASNFADPVFARKALFYVAAGLCLMSAFSIIWLLTPWQPVPVRVATAAVCAWGMLEEAETAVCRVTAGISEPVNVPMWKGLCDQQTGFPWSMLGIAIAGGLATWALDWLKARGPGS